MNQYMANVWAVIPAAGSGSRMQSETPKQFLLLNSKPIIEYSLDLILAHSAIAGIVLVGNPSDDKVKSILEKYPSVICVEGGRERVDSVAAGCEYIAEHTSAEWILVHDAARPCLHPRDLNNLIEQREQFATGALLAAPVVDTLKKLNPNGRLSTPSRDNLYRAFTPQLVRKNRLSQALKHCQSEAFIPTDESQAVERIGDSLDIVVGRQDNIKITYPEDIRLAQFILQSHSLESDND